MDASAYSALPRVVLDNGSGYVKFGLSSNKRPPHVAPNCIGHPKKKASAHYSDSYSSSNMDQGTGYSTHSAADSGTFVSEYCYTLLEFFCYRPQVNSLVYDANRQRHVWDRYIGRSNLTNTNGVISPGNLLSVNPETTSICVTEPNLCPAQSRQLLAEILFEDFGFPLACFLSSQRASAYFYETLKSKNKTGFNLNFYPNEPRPKKSEDISCCLVIDCGFGSTHSVPFVNGEPLQNAALRTAVAGSICNSYLKNITAMRSVNLEFNELVVQHMKEESCYVSRDFDLELRAAKRIQNLYGTRLSHQYILPIYTSKSKTHMLKHFTNYRKARPPLLTEHNEEFIKLVADGKVKDPEYIKSVISDQYVNNEGSGNKEESGSGQSEVLSGESTREALEQNQETYNDQANDYSDDQCVNLFSERFSVPEILFSPQDIKLKDCGIVDLAYRSISLCPPVVQPLLARNIFVCGGSTKYHGFIHRFYKDLRSLIPQAWDVGIYSIDDPSVASFYGAKHWTNNDTLFLSNAITRNAYFENGGSVIKIDELLN
ncbi:hypothetical protein MACK_000314 [Theileria orientalis]|uniref:Actin n=1 Tax=Theileria orientalis TaxID=68886 RepID=A0A976QS04_THEOR|nr:hypothetical protein MACK_000314 [Theileria orientalis]